MALTMLNEVDVQISNIDLDQLTADEALDRLNHTKTMIFTNLFPDEDAAKRDELFKIANYALTGNVSFPKGNKVEIFKDSDIPFLSQEQVVKRFKRLETKADNVFRVSDLLDIARFALTGVPF